MGISLRDELHLLLRAQLGGDQGQQRGHSRLPAEAVAAEARFAQGHRASVGEGGGEAQDGADGEDEVAGCLGGQV